MDADREALLDEMLAERAHKQARPRRTVASFGWTKGLRRAAFAVATLFGLGLLLWWAGHHALLGEWGKALGGVSMAFAMGASIIVLLTWCVPMVSDLDEFSTLLGRVMGKLEREEEPTEGERWALLTTGVRSGLVLVYFALIVDGVLRYVQ